MTPRYTVCDSCGHLHIVTSYAADPKCEICNSRRLWDFATEKMAREHSALLTSVKR